MLKMTIDNEEVVSDKDITINEEMLSASSSILNNVYPKEWEEDKDYTSRFYYPQDYSKALIQRSYVTQEAEAGTTIQVNGSVTLTDVDTTKNSRVLRLLGQTSQTGTPTPSSPIPVNVVSGDNEIVVRGRNLLDDSELINTIVPSSAGYIMQGLPFTINAGTYKHCLFVDNQPVLTNNIYAIAYRQGNATILERGTVNTNFTITEEQAKKIDNIRIYANDTFIASYSGKNITGCMIATDNVTTYEPYIGNTYNIDLPVENLFNKNGNLVLDYRLANDGGHFRDIGYYISEYIPINANTTYTKNSPTADYAHRVCFFSNNDTTSFISKSENNTFTTPSNAKYLRFCGLQTEIDTTQLEVGSKANAYTPYGTTPIELCSSQDGTKRDYFFHDKTLDKWYLHKEIGKYNIDTSTLGIKTNYTNIEYATIPKPNNYLGYGSFDKVEIICKSASYIAQAPSGWNDVNLVNKISGNPEANRWWLGFSKGTGITAIQNTLNGSYIYYPLATPTNTEITYQPLIDQLNALSSQ